MKQYVHCLEKSVIRTCAEFGVRAHTTEHTGVWVGDRKICAIGEPTWDCSSITLGHILVSRLSAGDKL